MSITHVALTTMYCAFLTRSARNWIYDQKFGSARINGTWIGETLRVAYLLVDAGANPADVRDLMRTAGCTFARAEGAAS